MEHLKVNLKNIQDYIPKNVFSSYKEKIVEANKILLDKSGKGNDFLGWLNLPNEISDENIADINSTVESLKTKVEVIVVIGIGGSYLGAKAILEAMAGSFDVYKKEREYPLIVFAGQTICEDYLTDLLSFLEDKKFGIVVISKSGTTTEPAIAFRFLKNLLEEKEGKEIARERIIAITDKEKGALRELSNNEEYKTFIIPDDVGGRYSVLTPVGLLPIAFAGYDIQSFVQGAVDMEKHLKEQSFDHNPAMLYAAARTALYDFGRNTEILVSYTPKLQYVSEWWKQLYGESEGKGNKGIFPASVNFTTDLHSLGQYIQEGLRNIFETVLTVAKPQKELSILADNDNLDGLNYLAGKRLDEVNKMAELGTLMAHLDGGVPNIKIEIPEINEYYLGQLVYFFEYACAVSGYTLGVNPFDQPGVEAYKKNMFRLLKKPGY
jgi:glucose-6-phosphate isomerase